MPDYMPRQDGTFLQWAQQFSTYLADHAGQLGLTDEQAAAIGSEVARMDATFAEHRSIQQQAKAMRRQKMAARGQVQNSIRTLVRQLQASPLVSNEQRAALGITVAGSGAAATNSFTPTVPIGTVDTSKRMRHVIRYRDAAASARTARPAHTLGCEVWVCINEAGAAVPLPGGEYKNLGLSITSPFTIDYRAADGGRCAHYMLRWIATDGAKGPWSKTISATIVG